MAKKICRQLGTYDYVDVANKLKEKTRPKRRTGRRDNVGRHLPTDRQLQKFIEKAKWSHKIRDGDGHQRARYRYEEPALPSQR